MFTNNGKHFHIKNVPAQLFPCASVYCNILWIVLVQIGRLDYNNQGEKLQSDKFKETFACRDVGLDCEFKTEAESREELMPKITEHAKSKHNMATIPDDMKRKVDTAIKRKN
ncbi:MAG: DUF1059 domain-containing protein [Nitrososphaerota archaeon]|nr:DUF1059 domain-containing protein [Nitrososphaerota archaeon]